MKFTGFLMTVALLSTAVASAQMGGVGGTPIGGPGGPGGGPRQGPRGAGFGMRPHKVVTGAPYSADVNNTTVRTLADSNTIQHVTTGHVARDSQGRTFSQETVTGGMFGQTGTKTFTFISDPVAGYSYVLNAETKTAMRRAIKTPSGSGGTFSPMHEGTAQATARPVNPNVVQADLGTQLMNGVAAQGKKTTHTIPAGQMGNTLPIVSTSESWYSADLQVVVYSKHTDVREGDSTYALTNIARAEPSAAMFQVPADYTIKDEGKGGPGRFSKGAAPR